MHNDYAQPELAAIQIETDSDDFSRGDVLLKGALAAGAVFGASMVGPFVSRALAQSDSGDVGILNFALTLEYLEATFYKEAQRRINASGDLKKLIDLIAEDEAQHVDALKATIKKLGGKPVAKPMFNFDYRGRSGFLKLAQTFEDTGVSAYNGAAPKIESKEVLGAAGSIVQIEARHAAAIRMERGQAPAPNAFDPALGKAKVLKAVGPFVA